jgi:CRISPR-associated protein Cas2
MGQTPNPPLSGYRFMWLLVMFDLPVGTKAERRSATKFRQWLLDEGYEMSQFSIYMRFCAGKEQVDRRVRAIAKARPGKGSVHLLAVTDRQFEQMVVFRGRERSRGRKAPNQLELF